MGSLGVVVVFIMYAIVRHENEITLRKLETLFDELQTEENRAAKDQGNSSSQNDIENARKVAERRARELRKFERFEILWLATCTLQWGFGDIFADHITVSVKW